MTLQCRRLAISCNFLHFGQYQWLKYILDSNIGINIFWTVTLAYIYLDSQNTADLIIEIIFDFKVGLSTHLFTQMSTFKAAI